MKNKFKKLFFNVRTLVFLIIFFIVGISQSDVSGDSPIVFVDVFAFFMALIILTTTFSLIALLIKKLFSLLVSLIPHAKKEESVNEESVKVEKPVKKNKISISFPDMFNAKSIKEENEQLKRLMTPEIQNAFYLENHVKELETKIESLRKNEEEIQNNVIAKQEELDNVNIKIRDAKEELVIMDESVLVQEFGLYEPRYDFINSDKYKERLTVIRDEQKQLVRDFNAVNGLHTWTVNGNRTKGKKMVEDTQKLLLRAFNNECDDIINRVKYNNYDASLKKMTRSRDTISKLGTIMNISITDKYFDLKVEELQLALEYRQKKQEEKEALREARAEAREIEKLQKEIDEQREKIEKEQSHYQNALYQVISQIRKLSSPTQELLDKKMELEAKLEDIEIAIEDLDYRVANYRAGYVYIISNIGAFGENVFKIGMTRRLNPLDRVYELGDASVPFRFDVHAMIFSDDAPALENALHKAFEDKKINMINQRREFFHVTLDEIKKVVRENYDKTVEFIDVPDAEQYRQSLKMKEEKNNNTESLD